MKVRVELTDEDFDCIVDDMNLDYWFCRLIDDGEIVHSENSSYLVSHKANNILGMFDYYLFDPRDYRDERNCVSQAEIDVAVACYGNEAYTLFNFTPAI